MTNVFGFSRVKEVDTYIASVKRFQFAPQFVMVDDEITGLNFVALGNWFRAIHH